MRLLIRLLDWWDDYQIRRVIRRRLAKPAESITLDELLGEFGFSREDLERHP